MNITIKINCSNAAFVDNEAAEVARILSTLADEVRQLPDLHPGDYEALRDINGNKVGEFKVSR